jgi:hypothetical protein
MKALKKSYAPKLYTLPRHSDIDYALAQHGHPLRLHLAAANRRHEAFDRQLSGGSRPHDRYIPHGFPAHYEPTEGHLPVATHRRPRSSRLRSQAELTRHRERFGQQRCKLAQLDPFNAQRYVSNGLYRPRCVNPV